MSSIHISLLSVMKSTSSKTAKVKSIKTYKKARSSIKKNNHKQTEKKENSFTYVRDKGGFSLRLLVLDDNNFAFSSSFWEKVEPERKGVEAVLLFVILLEVLFNFSFFTFIIIICCLPLG